MIIVTAPIQGYTSINGEEREDKMKVNTRIKKTLVALGLFSAFGSCHAREYGGEGPVVAISPHSIMGTQIMPDNGGDTPPLTPGAVRRVGQIGIEKNLKSLSEHVKEYTGVLTEQELSKIKEYLDLHPNTYIVKNNTSKTESYSIFDWYEEKGNDANIYRLIWMSFGDTIDASKYGEGLVPFECIAAHVFYYQKIDLR